MVQREGNKVHAGLALLAGPFVGLAYVIALPFLAIGTVIALVAKKMLEALYDLVGYLVSFAWRPTESYLAGKKGKKDSRK